MLLDCQNCNAKVDAIELEGYDYEERDETEDGQPINLGDYRITFLRCPSCSEPLLAKQPLYNGKLQDRPARLFPPTRRPKPRVPKDVRKGFDEASRCVQARCFLATALMCRRTLESVCHNHGTGDLKLYAALKSLHEKKVIDDRLYEWAEALRKDGNLAAHDPAADVAPDDARDLVAFTEAILDYVFVLHHQFEEFKRRRAERTALAAPPPTTIRKGSDSAGG